MRPADGGRHEPRPILAPRDRAGGLVASAPRSPRRCQARRTVRDRHRRRTAALPQSGSDRTRRARLRSAAQHIRAPRRERRLPIRHDQRDRVTAKRSRCRSGRRKRPSTAKCNTSTSRRSSSARRPTCRFVSSRNRSARTSGTTHRRESSRSACRSGGGNYVPPPVRPIPPPNPPPVSVVRLIAQQPAPGANVVNRFVTLSADFSNQVNANSVRVWLDGADITSRCSVSRASVSYRPPAPLAFGGHTMRVAGVDAGGSRFDRSWSFNVSGAAPPPSPIALRAQQPAPGASVANRFAPISAEFTNRVVPGSVRVLLDGADRTSQCGISATAFSYKPPAPLGFGSHTVRVTGRGEGGLAFDRSWSFTVAGSSPSHHTDDPAARTERRRRHQLRRAGQYDRKRTRRRHGRRRRSRNRPV